MTQPRCLCGPVCSDYECKCVRAADDTRRRGAQCGACFAKLVTVATYEKKINDSGERRARKSAVTK